MEVASSAGLSADRLSGDQGCFRVEGPLEDRALFDRSEISVEFLDQRGTGGDVESGDSVVVEPIEVLAEGPEAVAVR